MKILTETELMNQAPSIFSMQAHAKTSSKYSLIPTIESVRELQNAGFYPVKVQESRCRNSENKPYAKHLIRFRREGDIEVGGNLPEIVLINSHNGLSSYQLRAGIYRLVCSNGLIVGNELFERSIKHQGDCPKKVLEAATELVDIIPKALQIAEEWKRIRLKQEQKQIFAQSAAMLKWSEGESIIEPERLLRPRRFQDENNDLWTTFNTVQENLIQGGVKYYDREKRRRGTTRAVNSVSENSRLNTSLWALTEKMAELAR